MTKCVFMKFSLKKSRSVSFIYSICLNVLPAVTQVKDLGITFTTNFNFNVHITNITKKSFQMIGFLRRVLKPFKDPDVFRTMFQSLVRTRLEYCSQIWAPSAKYLVEKLERVQKKYLQFMCYSLRISYAVPYLSLCKSLNFQPLYLRRNVCDLLTFNKILINKIDCPALVGSVNFNVPRRRLRSTPCFTETCRLNVRKNSPLVRFHKLANATGLDVFERNCYTFKKNARSFYFDY